MGSIITVYKVKDLNTNLFMNKHGGWDKKGKTWESLGMLKLSMSTHGYWSKSTHYPARNADMIFGDHIKIISIKIVETEDNMSSLDDFVAQQRRYADLEQKFGESFRDLVERIEKQGQTDQFQWVLVCQSGYDFRNNVLSGDIVEMLDILKSMKLKQNKDYKKASTYKSGKAAVAFTSKMVAIQVRLAMRGKVDSIDIKDFVETNLDS